MKKKIRKMLSLILCVGMLCNLTACGLVGSKDSSEETEATTEATTEVTTVAMTEATTEAMTEATTEATAETLTDASTNLTTFGMTIMEFYNALNQAIDEAGYKCFFDYSVDETDSDLRLALMLELEDATIQLPIYLDGYKLTEDDNTMSIITLVLPYEDWISFYFGEEDDTVSMVDYEVAFYHLSLAAIRVVLGVADSIDLEMAETIIKDVVISSTPTYTEEDLCYAYYFDGDEAESSNAGIVLAHTDTMEEKVLN